MPIIQVLIIIVVVGVILWLVNSMIPMDGKVKQILNAVVVIALVLWLLDLFLGLGLTSGFYVGRHR